MQRGAQLMGEGGKKFIFDESEPLGFLARPLLAGEGELARLLRTHPFGYVLAHDEEAANLSIRLSIRHVGDLALAQAEGNVGVIARETHQLASKCGLQVRLAFPIVRLTQNLTEVPVQHRAGVGSKPLNITPVMKSNSLLAVDVRDQQRERIGNQSKLPFA